jgi:hypothetical protein
MNKNLQRNINQPFLFTFFQKMKTKTSPLVFCEIWTSKIASNGSWLRATAPVGGGRVVFITHSSLAVGLKNRQWKHISTGGYLNTTASGNRIFPLAVGVTEPPVEIRFSLAVLLHQPPV